MATNWLAVSLFVVAGFFFFLALRLVLRRPGPWIWLKAPISLTLLLLAGATLLLANDLRRYVSSAHDQPIASVEFEQLEPKMYIAKIALYENGVLREFLLRGDQWQVDARILRWKGLAQAIGVKPGFRLERISGRYAAVSEELRERRTVYSLIEEDDGVFDLWGLARTYKDRMPMVDAVYGSAVFLPMVDEGVFELRLGATGLTAVPFNSRARDAMELWLN